MSGAAKIKTCMITIEFAGVVHAKDKSPYVYFIKRGYLLYIGETQKNPVYRWCAHLQENGSFRDAVIRVDEEILTGNFLTHFFAYRCTRIETDVGDVERRQATQYVEDKLHNRVICNGIPTDNDVRIISSTVKTAPRVRVRDWLDDYTDALYEMFVKDLINRSKE
jgi:hypothetical protein